MTKPVIYIIAGEASGDVLGAGLMEALREELKGNVSFTGVGGEKMTEQGLQSLFPMHELSIIGFAELLPHIFQLKKRISQTAEDIIHKKPDMVVTIDTPGFSFRVARMLREHIGKDIKLVHYVAPTVWAYKPERAAKTAALFDHLMVLLPFEPAYFEKEGLPTTFVGHPVLELWKEKGDGAAFRARNAISDNAPLLLVLPGSRRGEIKKHMPVLKQAVTQLKKQIPGLTLLFTISPYFSFLVESYVKYWGVPYVISTNPKDKKDAFAAATAALAKSGTVTLEVAAAGLPMVMFYKVNPISAWMVRRWLMISSYNLLNILSGKTIIPEFVQEACIPERIADTLAPLLTDETAQRTQTTATQEALAKLNVTDGINPNKKAAKTIAFLLPTTN